jgi:long-chain acyl-CoA synthetase
LIDVGNGRSFTYRETLLLAGGVIELLNSYGLKKGDRFGVFMQNSPLYVILYIAAFKSGIVMVPLDLEHSQETLEFIIVTSKLKIILIDSNRKKIQDKNLQVIMLKIEDICPKKYDVVLKDDEYPIIHFTSGTTKLPKGLVHRSSSYIRNAEAFSELFNFSPTDRFYNTLPLSYMAGFYNLSIVPFINGASVVIGKTFSSFSAMTYWKTVRKYNVNVLWIVPSIASMLLAVDRGDTGRRVADNQIRLALCSTAPLTTTLKGEFFDRYGLCLYEGYGLSELLFVTTNSPEKINSNNAGYPLNGIKLHCTHDSPSEIKVETPDCMIGYLSTKTSLPEKIKSTLFNTGDLGIFSIKEGLTVNGRMKDLIIKGGVNVSPAAIEASILNKFEEIREVAVTGVNHEIYGQDVIMFIALKSNVNTAKKLKEIKLFCKQSFSKYMIPSEVHIVTAMPKSSSGKIIKHKLISQLKQTQT